MNTQIAQETVFQMERLQAHFGKIEPLAMRDWLQKASSYSSQEMEKAIYLLISQQKYKPKFAEFCASLHQVVGRKSARRASRHVILIEDFRKEQSDLWIARNMPAAQGDECWIARTWIDELIICQHTSKLFTLPFGIFMRLNYNEDCMHAGRALCKDIIAAGWEKGIAAAADDEEPQYVAPPWDIAEYRLEIPSIVWESYEAAKLAGTFENRDYEKSDL